MNVSLNDLPFPIDSLIPYNQFNWDCVDGLDCIYKDIQSTYVTIVSQIGKGLDAQQKIIQGIVDSILKHYVSNLDFQGDATSEIYKLVESAIRIGLDEVRNLPSLSSDKGSFYAVYRESSCGRYYPVSELWPSPITTTEYYGPYPNLAILHSVMANILPIKNSSDLVIGGDETLRINLNSSYYSHPNIQLNGQVYSPNDRYGDANLNMIYNKPIQESGRNCDSTLTGTIVPPSMVIEVDPPYPYDPPPVDIVDPPYNPPPVIDNEGPIYIYYGEQYTHKFHHFIGNCKDFNGWDWFARLSITALDPNPPEMLMISKGGMIDQLETFPREFNSVYLLRSEYDAYLVKCAAVPPPPVIEPPVIEPPYHYEPPKRPGTYEPPKVIVDPPHYYDPPKRPGTYDPPKVFVDPRHPVIDPPIVPLSQTCCDDIVKVLSEIRDRLGSGDKKVIGDDDIDIDMEYLTDEQYLLSIQYDTDITNKLARENVTQFSPPNFADMGTAIADYLYFVSTPTS